MTELFEEFQKFRKILCVCPCCGDLVRVSDLRLKLKGRVVRTWLDDYEKLSLTLDKKEERFDEALAEFREAIKLEPNLLESHLNIGNLFLKKAVFPQALVHYKKVVELNPEHSQAHNNLAVIYYRLENYQKAWDHVQKAEAAGLQVHPDLKKELLKKIKRDCSNLLLSSDKIS